MRTHCRNLVVILALLLGAVVGGEPTLAQPDPSASTLSTVALELVLDASGSMAETLPDGTTRIDAARIVVGDLIAGLPDDAGLAVGFRVFGQDGDNTEGGRAESCASTDLVVPVEGVDRVALGMAVEAYEPVGWTPIALALGRAAEDFPDDGADSGVVLVTDGEETCGGDPCAVASELGAASVDLRVDVVGFATTDEQNDLLACIADATGGELYGAEDAEELGDALATIVAAREIDLAEPEVLFDDGFIADCAAAMGDPDAIRSANDRSRTVGTAGDDVIIGSDGDDLIDAGSGDDLVCARGGDDVIDTGPGDDTVVGGFGDDVIRGGPGDDALGGGADPDDIDGQAGDDLLFGGDNDDVVSGGTGDDALDAYPGEDTIEGGAGTDACATGPGQSATACEVETQRGDLREAYESAAAPATPSP